MANATAAAGGASAQAEALPLAHRRSVRGSAAYNPLGSEDGSDYEVCTSTRYILATTEPCLASCPTRVLTYLPTDFLT